MDVCIFEAIINVYLNVSNASIQGNKYNLNDSIYKFVYGFYLS